MNPSKDTGRKQGKWTSRILRTVAVMLLLSFCYQGAMVQAAAERAPLVQTNATHATQKSNASLKPISASIITNIVRKVNPSVVTIVGQDMDALDEGYAAEDSISYGSGVIFREDGWIITNGHVMERLKKPFVVTADGKRHTVDKFFYDSEIDIAVVKIKAKGLKPATFTANKIKADVGEEVLAFGTPISITLRNSVSRGIISGVERSVNGGYKLIQTDASINPGNSGGPLVNMKGEVIGINTSKYYGEDIDNVGFAIPMDTVRWAASDLIQYGEVRYGLIGIELEENWAMSVGLPSSEPLKIVSVTTKTAERAGIRTGDLLYSIDGTIVNQMSDVREALKGKVPGDRVKLELSSNGKKRTVTLKLS